MRNLFSGSPRLLLPTTVVRGFLGQPREVSPHVILIPRDQCPSVLTLLPSQFPGRDSEWDGERSCQRTAAAPAPDQSSRDIPLTCSRCSRRSSCGAFCCCCCCCGC